MPKLESMLWCCLDRIVVVADAVGVVVDVDDVGPQHRLLNKRLPKSVKKNDLILNCFENVHIYFQVPKRS